MPLQHFYSRIPARVSLFNRADSFDTFACSAGVTGDFIEKELGFICENKPDAGESDRIRRGELSPVYCQFTAKSGEVVQSSVSYIPLDYSGERSSYLVHSLIYAGNEQKQLLYAPNAEPILSSLFQKDLSSFAVTSPKAKPDTDYPILSRDWTVGEPTVWLCEGKDATSVKRLLYAVLATLCGKIKSVFLVLDGDTSVKGLRYFNTLYRLIPYHLRPLFSFASRVRDAGCLSGLKFRCVEPSASVIPSAKGAVCNVETGVFTGVKDEDVLANITLVEFFYGLLQNEALRLEFLRFVDHAVTTIPAMATPSLKQLTDFVFMFEASSGMYDINAVLPNDTKMQDFFAVYEKFRTAFEDEYRINAMMSLRRYSDAGIVIPKQIFSKIAKIYPTEPDGAKRVIMGVALSLIHTDTMRDKLFTFITANYDKENESSQSTIVHDFCRVFYGGFLQEKILEFFGTVYPNASGENRCEMVEKILLAMRTKNVQKGILDFCRQYYGEFDDESKKLFYTELLENMADGDELAGELILMADACLQNEDETYREPYAVGLRKLLEKEQRKENHPLFRRLIVTEGISGDILCKAACHTWRTRHIFEEYVGALANMNPQTSAGWIVKMFTYQPEWENKILKKLSSQLKKNIEDNKKRAGAVAWIKADAYLSQNLPPLGEDAKAFAKTYTKSIAEPNIISAIPTVFGEGPEGPDAVIAYAGKHLTVAHAENYGLLMTYDKLQKCLADNDVQGIWISVAELPTKVRPMVEQCLQKKSALESMDPLQKICLSSYIRRGIMDFAGANDNLSHTDDTYTGECAVLMQLVQLGNLIYAVDVGDNPTPKEAVIDEASGMERLFFDYLQRFGKKGEKALMASLDGVDFAEPYKEYLIQLTKKENTSKKGFFASLFGKK